MSQIENFSCLRCGKCCMLRIKISEDDIKNIKNKGHNNFTDKDLENNKFIKMINGFCYFLKLDKGINILQNIFYKARRLQEISFF